MSNSPLIFAVEDDAATRLLLEKAITHLGFSFEGFSRVDEVQERLEEVTPDVMVVDGLLPDGSGIDLIRNVVSERVDGRPKFIFFSAIFRDLRTHTYLRSLGVEAILDKPASILRLREKVAELLNIRLLDSARAAAA